MGTIQGASEGHDDPGDSDFFPAVLEEKTAQQNLSLLRPAWLVSQPHT